MKWINKALIFALCVLSTFNTDIGNSYVAAVLLIIIATCLLDAFPTKAMKIAITILWTILSLLFPFFMFFWPLIIYDIAFGKVWFLSLAYPLCAIATFAFTSQINYIFCIATCSCSLILCYYSRKINLLYEDMLRTRDESKEINILLEQQNEELLYASEMEVNLARLTERSRISREIHDNVGHILARSIMQTGAVMAQNNDTELNESLEHLKETLTLAINSMRESVHDLRDESLDLYSSINQSLTDFSAYDINLNYDISADTPRNIKYCFITVLNEALANTARHSNADKIRIDLFEHPAFYKLYYHDNGTARPHAKPGSDTGMGLENMRRRVNELGGIFNINTDKGFSININIPKAKEE